eukprot:8333995-Ditylum_brightwellii.AAC.1
MDNTNNPVDAIQHNLDSGNPKGRENYCETLQTQFTQDKIFARVNQLYNKIKNGCYTHHEVATQYEEID